MEKRHDGRGSEDDRCAGSRQIEALWREPGANSCRGDLSRRPSSSQALLGHADAGTTQVYTGAPTLDELAAAIKGIRFAVEGEQTVYPLDTHPAQPARGADRNRTGDVVESGGRAESADWAELQAARAVSVYRPLFEPGGGV